jgi:hypothetical protein
MYGARSGAAEAIVTPCRNPRRGAATVCYSGSHARDPLLNPWLLASSPGRLAGSPHRVA